MTAFELINMFASKKLKGMFDVAKKGQDSYKFPSGFASGTVDSNLPESFIIKHEGEAIDLFTHI